MTLCTLAFAAIRAQPYYDSELRAFLLPPEGCEAPCFMGIRPGVTTVDEAIAILKATGWVGNIRNLLQPRGCNNSVTGEVGWDWSGEQPYWIDDSTIGKIVVIDDVVLLISVSTRISFGQVHLTLGTPTTTDFNTTRRADVYAGRLRIDYREFYPINNLEFSSNYLCPSKPLWFVSAWLLINEFPSSGNNSPTKYSCNL
jgi:hypothetical protein